MKNYIIKIKNIDFKLICISVFCLPYLFRIAWIGDSFGWINFLGFLGLTLLFQRKWKKNENDIFLFNTKARLFLILGWFALILFFFVTNSLSNTMPFKTQIKYVVTCFLPYFFIFAPLTKEEIKLNFCYLCKILVFSCTIICLCGIVDKFNNYKIGTFFANYYNVKSLIDVVNNDTRMVSYMGHPLLSVEMFILCFCVNCIKDRYIETNKNKLLNFYVLLLCFCGTVLTGSKTGIVLFLALCVVFYTNLKYLHYLFVGIVIISLFYEMGFLDALIKRFVSGIKSGDLTTGRNTAIVELIDEDVLKFNFLWGHDNSYSHKMSVALEYPVLRWAYRFGIVFSLGLSFYMFVLPIIKCLKNFKIEILASIGAIIVDVNTYSGLCNTSDNVFIFIIVIGMIMFLNEALNNDDKNVKTLEKNDYLKWRII